MGPRVAPYWLSTLGGIVALGAMPDVAFSQAERPPDNAERIFAEIKAAQAAEGPRSPALIQLLSELGSLYEAEGDHALATAALEEARQVVRANYGLHTIEQLPLIQQALANQRALGDFAMVQALEEELLDVAERNPDDLRTVAVHRDAGMRRLDVLRRFLAGEAPSEVYPEAGLFGFYKEDVVDGLISDAQIHLADAAAVILRNRLYSSAELRELEVASIRANDMPRQRRQQLRTARHEADPRPENGLAYDPHLVERRNILADLVSRADAPDVPAALQDALRGTPPPVRGAMNANRYQLDMTAAQSLAVAGVYDLGVISRYQFGKDSYTRLIAYDELAFGASTDAAALRDRLEAYLRLADWELLYSQNGRALDAYARVLELLKTNDFAAPLLAEVFAPPIPTVLPTFLSNPFDTPPSPRYIEVSFEVTKYGESRRVEILSAAPDVPDAAKEELVTLIKGSRFRPRVKDGELAAAAAVVVRYYLDDPTDVSGDDSGDDSAGRPTPPLD